MIIIITGLTNKVPELQSIVPLLINYENFNVEQNATTVGWTFEDGCSEVFAIEGYTLTSLRNRLSNNLPEPIVNYTVHAAVSSINIQSDQLVISSTGEPIVYRIVAVDENGTICSDETSQNSFYRFDSTYVNRFLL